MIHTARHAAFFLMLSTLALFAQIGGDAFLAIVGDKVITLYDVMQNTYLDEQQLKKEFMGEELEKKVGELRRHTLDYLIERELCYKEFKALKAQVPSDFLQQRLNEIVEQRANGNIALFEEALNKQHMTMKEFKEHLEKELAVYMLINDRKNRGNKVSDGQVIALYEKEKEKMSTPSSHHIAVIQLRKNGKYAAKLQETISEINAKLMEGTDRKSVV